MCRSARRRAGSGTGFSPVERELVFDIDLTDYDDVRTCGKEGHICAKCWPLMAAAIKVCRGRGAAQEPGVCLLLGGGKCIVQASVTAMVCST